MDLASILSYLSLSVMGIIAYSAKRFHERILKLEDNVTQGMSEEQVRILLQDKLDPIREDMKELRVKMDRIFDLLIKR